MKSFGNLPIKINPALRKELRRLEKLKKQLIGVNWSKYFSEICITNNLMPKHINIDNNIYLL